jgi:hypothetical protein
MRRCEVGRTGEGAGDTAQLLRWPGITRLVRRPRACRRTARTRAASGLRPEALWPPAGSRLTAGGPARKVMADASQTKGQPAPGLKDNRTVHAKRGPTQQ